VKRAFISSVLLLGLTVVGPSCRVHKPSPAAHGTGYGAGLARQAVTLGGEKPTTGTPLTGFPDPGNPPEAIPGQPSAATHAPPAPAHGH
jgi:hypothetical protein